MQPKSKQVKASVTKGREAMWATIEKCLGLTLSVAKQNKWDVQDAARNRPAWAEFARPSCLIPGVLQEPPRETCRVSQVPPGRLSTRL